MKTVELKDASVYTAFTNVGGLVGEIKVEYGFRPSNKIISFVNKYDVKITSYIRLDAFDSIIKPLEEFESTIVPLDELILTVSDLTERLENHLTTLSEGINLIEITQKELISMNFTKKQ